MGPELCEVSQRKLRRIGEGFGDLVEDEGEFTPEFEYSIQRSEHDMAAGIPARAGEPQGL